MSHPRQSSSDDEGFIMAWPIFEDKRSYAQKPERRLALRDGYIYLLFWPKIPSFALECK